MDLVVLEEAIDQLRESAPSSWCDPDSLQFLYRQLSRLEAVVSEATAAFDASGSWALDGARNAAAWVATRCHERPGRAKAMVRRGRGLRYLPHGAQAFASGTVPAAQIDLLVGARTPQTAVAMAGDEEMLVAQATELRYGDFEKVVQYWKHRADPNGAEASDEDRRQSRDVYLARSFEGMWLGQMTLDPLSGAIVAGELERLEQALFEADWAEAASRLDQDPTPGDLARSPRQRRADALVEMATRSRTAPADGRRPGPLFSVLVDYPTLKGPVCELADGTVLNPGALVPWLTEAYIERVVFGPENRVEVSATARLFTGATRRALELRDRQCTHPYCDIAADKCQADHIIPFAHGGPTTQENGQMRCGFHNRLRNQRPPPDG
jgi:hypothetical protein